MVSERKLMSQPITFDMRMQSALVGHPAVYPNSEKITPPVGKEKTRVVEPSTRSDVSADVLKLWRNKQEELELVRQKGIMLSYNRDKSINREPAPSGQIINFES